MAKFDNVSFVVTSRDGGIRTFRDLVGYWKHKKGFAIIEHYGESNVGVARSEAASLWLEKHMTEWSLWIDDDIETSWGELVAFLNCAMSSSHDIVVGSYVTKQPGGGKLTVQFENPHVILGDGGGYEKIVGAGFGLVLAKRKVFEAIGSSLPRVRYRRTGVWGHPYFIERVMPSTVDGALQHVGEDFAFFSRARAAGASCVCDTRVRLRHVGPYSYQWEDADSTVDRFDRIVVSDTNDRS